ncbi:hypothetical protein [Botrimarina mediterranea]|uniref:hypothetical protein n=1 Tax=Botrimarina mediterranea TaxID=2528022 RepID=UPI00118B49DE|nr:hypothetical protein K2D_05860 [Planctomycetes bacterium K2D]
MSARVRETPPWPEILTDRATEDEFLERIERLIAAADSSNLADASSTNGDGGSDNTYADPIAALRCRRWKERIRGGALVAIAASVMWAPFIGAALIAGRDAATVDRAGQHQAFLSTPIGADGIVPEPSAGLLSLIAVSGWMLMTRARKV